MKDSTYGYWKLDPLPSEEELTVFYTKKYSNLTKKGGRAPDVRKQLTGGEEAKNESDWLRRTLYTDIRDMLSDNLHQQRRHVLEVGCGTGKFLNFMAEEGWNVMGVEPSDGEASLARNTGVKVYNMTIETFFQEHGEFKYFFDAIVLLNVLEHVRDPLRILDITKELLADNGLICLRVPNDFSELQFCAEKKTARHQWWIAIPDHVNYFNCQSLRALVESRGFSLLDVTADFPMEFFLLMGDEYIDNPKVGSECHKKRVAFELSLSDSLRRKLYKAFAKVGIGRDIILWAKLCK